MQNYEVGDINWDKIDTEYMKCIQLDIRSNFSMEMIRMKGNNTYWKTILDLLGLMSHEVSGTQRPCREREGC